MRLGGPSPHLFKNQVFMDLHERLDLLADYQRVLLALDRLTAQRDAVPTRRAEEGAKRARSEKKLHEAKEALLRLQNHVATSEARIKEVDLRREKAKQATATLKDNATFQRAQAELKNMDQEIASLEDVVLDELESLERERARLKTLQLEHEALNTAVERAHAQLDAEDTRLEGELRALHEESAQARAAVPDDLRQHFEGIRGTRGGKGLCFAEGDGKHYHCGNCSMDLHMQVISKLLVGRELATCQGCGVILRIDRDMYEHLKQRHP